jgi:hypothetical protein
VTKRGIKGEIKESKLLENYTKYTGIQSGNGKYLTKVK